MQEKLNELRTRLREVDDLQSAVSVLNWDQSTYMPPAGAAARGRQMATLSRIAQEKFTDPAVGRLLDELEPYVERELDYESDDASLVRVTRRDYERSVKVPPAFTAAFYQHIAVSYNEWAESRPTNDFARVQPYLEKSLDLSRQLADFFPGYEHVADPLIAFSDYGMSVSTIRPLFDELRQRLAPLTEKIVSQEVDDSFLHRTFPEEKQLAFGRRVIERYGYDFNRGRQDKTHHPFMTTFALDDVRITTRVKENNLNEALFSTLHEAGHALYELGIDHALEATPLASGASSGMHESQSRLWENQVGRSLPFWRHFYPQLQDTFPNQLGDVSLEQFYRAVNKVQRSLIRTDADEVTYNLHVMLRFELELQLLEGNLAVADLPDAWHARYERDLGVRAPDDRDGVLQDVHWFGGIVGGAFQGYTLGNVLAAMFYAQALKAHPEITSEIEEEGRFDALHNWLRENIYRHGAKFTTGEMVQRVTGGSLTVEPYFDYLNKKFGEIYDLGS